MSNNNFYNYIRKNNPKFNEKIYFESNYSEDLAKVMFNILLFEQSDVLQNFFMYYNNENPENPIYPNDLFNSVVLRAKEGAEAPYITVKYDIEHRVLYIHPAEDVHMLVEFNEQMERIRREERIAITRENIPILIAKRKLYIRPENRNKIHSIYSSLDLVLKNLPQFNNLNKEIKKRILNGEFLEQYAKENHIKEINIEELLESIKKSRKREAERSIEKWNRRYKDYMLEVDTIIDNIQRTQATLLGIESYTLDNDKLQRTFRDPRIQFIEVIDNYMFIKTEPIILNYDRNKVQAITRLKHLSPSHNLGIGRHTITINLSTFEISFTADDDFKNYHIEDYICYGTFTNHIADARKDMNLPKLISLSLQMLQYATIGDAAGNQTIHNAYEINSDNAVVFGDKAYYHHQFLNNYEKIKHLQNKQNTVDIEEEEEELREQLQREIEDTIVDEAVEEQEQETTAIDINDLTRAVLDEADEVNGVIREEHQEQIRRTDREDN